MDDRVFGRMSPNIDDRRGDVLSALQEAQMIMQQIPELPHLAAATMPEPPLTPLGVQAGMLDIGRYAPAASFAQRFAPGPQMDWRR